MAFQTNASGTFREGHFYIWHIYLITASVVTFSEDLVGRKDHNLAETRQEPKVF
jgi:hypothetical protein